jgi:hypothetical protein
VTQERRRTDGYAGPIAALRAPDDVANWHHLFCRALGRTERLPLGEGRDDAARRERSVP